MSSKRILVLAPHTDDGELGCGATIAKQIEKGDEVYYVAFSICSRSLPAGWAPDTLAKEVALATKELGLPNENLILFDFDVRRFYDVRQDILEEMVKLKKQIQPDIVYVPSPTDIHQDHQVISQEGLRAFKNCSLLGYEMPWNNIAFNTRAFSIVDDNHIQKKINALEKYETQKQRTYLNPDFIRSLATTRGVQIGVKYAEAFEVIRWML
ncbi:MAG: PIG-L deacetylase family protein [Flavobacteriales bacterium]|jgi:LmbE family N-acetylglucosaminyl deacetylase